MPSIVYTTEHWYEKEIGIGIEIVPSPCVVDKAAPWTYGLDCKLPGNIQVNDWEPRYIKMSILYPTESGSHANGLARIWSTEKLFMKLSSCRNSVFQS